MTTNTQSPRKFIEKMFNFNMIDCNTRNDPEKLEFITSMLNFGKNAKNTKNSDERISTIDLIKLMDDLFTFNFYFKNEKKMNCFLHPVEDVPPHSYELESKIEKIYPLFKQYSIQIDDVVPEELENGKWIVKLYLHNENDCPVDDENVRVVVKMSRVDAKKNKKNKIKFECLVIVIQSVDDDELDKISSERETRGRKRSKCEHSVEQRTESEDEVNEELSSSLEM